MKVTLLSWTPDALATLVYTKNTRLSMTAGSFADFRERPEEELLKEWEYMKNTIQSSWEFLEFIFLIEGVSRAFTHQLVRHRIGTKFAQQSQRTVDMEGFDFIMPPSGQWVDTLMGGIDDLQIPRARETFIAAQDDIDIRYTQLRELGVPPEDARAILPTNVSTNINFGASLRTLHNMALLRLCTKAQGEFQNVFRAIKREVEQALPWAAEVLQVQCCWTGTCAFPTFPVDDCILKPGVYDPVTALSYDGDRLRTLAELRIVDKERG